MVMRREDLGQAPDEAASTLDEALQMPDLDDVEVVRTMWDDLATSTMAAEAASAPRSTFVEPGVDEPRVAPVEPPVPMVEVPDDEPETEGYVPPSAPTRRRRRKDRKEARGRRREAKLQYRRH